jgi:hypothetical protein
MYRLEIKQGHRRDALRKGNEQPEGARYESCDLVGFLGDSLGELHSF